MKSLLSTTEKILSQVAKKASRKAYAPYSKFSVGAAIRTSRGSIFTGSNVENASYGLTCCAERNAIFAMANAGERKIECVAIFTPTEAVTAPCGACRQVIREFGPHARVISTGIKGACKVWTMDQLLPDSFGPDYDLRFARLYSIAPPAPLKKRRQPRAEGQGRERSDHHSRSRPVVRFLDFP